MPPHLTYFSFGIIWHAMSTSNRLRFLTGAVGASAVGAWGLHLPASASGAKAGPYCVALKSREPFDFTLGLLDADGKDFRVSELDGHPVWLVFFTSWCPPCNDEASAIVAIEAANRASGLRVVGISVQERPEPVRDFVQRHGIDYPVALDSSGRVFRDFGFHTLPTHMFLDRHGSITCVRFGDLGRREMDNEIAVAIERGAQAPPPAGTPQATAKPVM
jgi:peroxiredoxin